MHYAFCIDLTPLLPKLSKTIKLKEESLKLKEDSNYALCIMHYALI